MAGVSVSPSVPSKSKHTAVFIFKRREADLVREERGMQGPKPPPQLGLGCLRALSNECQRVIYSIPQPLH